MNHTMHSIDDVWTLEAGSLGERAEDSNVCIFGVHGGAMIAKEFAKTQKPPNFLASAATLQVEKLHSQEHKLRSSDS